jgi:hypothetical protein
MKTKKIYILLPLMIISFWSCNPMEDIYNDLDNKYSNIEPATYTDNIVYTFVANDYKNAQNFALADATNYSDSVLAKLINTNLAFNQRFLASDYIGKILQKNNPKLGEGSAAIVTYNEDEGQLKHVTAMMNATEYTLTKADYAVSAAAIKANRCFFAAYPAETNLPVILDSAFQNEKANDVVYVEYNYSTEEPRSGNEIDEVSALNYGFDYDLGNFTTVNVLGDQVWGWGSYDNGCAKVAGYSGGVVPNEDWLISPEIDLGDFSDSKIQVSQAYKYLNGVAGLLEIKISENNTEGTNGDWTNLEFQTLPAEDFVFVNSEFLDISAYDGKSIKIAFVYKTNDTIAATWEIGQIRITGYGPVLSKSSPIYNYYMYDEHNSKWIYYPGSITLQPADYNDFPGPKATHSFSSTYPAKNYLPKYLDTKYPYSQQGDTLLISYKYGQNRIVERYEHTLSASTGLLAWGAYNTIKTKTDQFVVINGEWLFDPTVRITMLASQLQLIVNYVKTTYPSTVDSYGDGEFYYGASAYYRNFDLRLSKRTNIPGFEGLNEAEGIALTWQRVQEALIKFLELQYPDATPDIKGVTVYYWLTFNTYENNLSKKTYIGCFRYTNEDGFIRDKEKEDTDYGSSTDEATKALVNWNR